MQARSILRPRPTFGDYLAIAAGPILVGLLVGSLALFLIELFYVGQYAGRLRFIMGMFVMGAVGVARISIDDGREYSMAYAFPLAGVTALAAWRFVEFSGPLRGFSLPLSGLLIALIWWCTDRLIWDCTVIDERQADSGEGLLQTAGLEDQAAVGGPTAAEHSSAAEAHRASVVDAVTDTTEKPQTTWQRFRTYRQRPHAPGVWVLYFSLAALPIFGLGQLLLPRDDLAGRRFVFQLLVVYVMAGLGLLLTTSFLSLRRYLRQRRLEMPAAMARGWVLGGVAMIVVTLVFCLLLPRRNPEYSLSHLPIFARSADDLQTSPWAFGNDGPERQQANRQVTRDDAERMRSGRPKSSGGANDSRAKASSGGKDQAGSTSQDDRESSRETQASQSRKNASPAEDPAESPQAGDSTVPPSDQQPRQSSDASDRSSQERNGDQGDATREPPRDSPSSRDAAAPRESPSEADTGSAGDASDPDPSSEAVGDDEVSSPETPDSNPAEGSPSSRDAQVERAQTQTSPPPGRPSSNQPFASLPQLPSTLGALLKWIYWAIILLAGLYFLIRYWRQVTQAIREFATRLRALWGRLFGKREEQAAISQEVAPPVDAIRPFSSFSDPFVSGSAEKWAVDELIRYSFEAFQAWSNDQGLRRQPDQTVHEFARAVAARRRDCAAEAQQLAELVSWSAYARDRVPRNRLTPLRQLWQRMKQSRR